MNYSYPPNNQPGQPVPPAPPMAGVQPPVNGYSVAPQGYGPAPQGCGPVPQGYGSISQGYSPVPQGYPPVPQGYVPMPQGYMPPPQGYPPAFSGYPVYGYPPVAGYGMVSPQQWEQQMKKNQEKTELRSRSNAIGAGLLFVQLISTVLAFLIPSIIDFIFPGASTNGGLYYDALEYAIYSPLAVFMAMWLGLKCIKKPLAPLVPFEKPKYGLWTGCILFSFLFILAGNLVADGVAMLSPYTMENMQTALGNDPTTLSELGLSLLYMAAIPAIVEELAFRGIVLGLLRPYGDKFAIVVSSALFGLLHGNLIQMAFAFFGGMAMAYVVVRTKNIVPAMILHFINNGVSSVLTYVSMYVPEEKQGMLVLLLYGSWLLLGLFGYGMLKLGYSQPITQCYQPNKGCLTTGECTKTVAFSATIIGSIVIYGLSAIAFALPPTFLQ